MFKKIIISIITILGLTLTIPNQAEAQSFFSYQTITKHTIHFVIAWENKVVLGAGYGYRTSDIKFSEISFEYRAPIDEFFNGKNFEVTTGVHNRFLASKTVVAGGAHLKFEKKHSDEKDAFLFGLAMTFLGGYQVATNLDDKPSSVLGARATYTPVLFAKVTNSDGSTSKHGFKSHELETGLHWDIIIKRSLGLSAQPTVANTWTKSEELRFEDTPSWDPQGHFYFGPSFWRRK
ncbi:MAG: hypothetical protein GY751_06545 [Bacteroidetes bacterium]|nr:hypothetical protein [Bacteroidota bacterium]